MVRKIGGLLGLLLVLSAVAAQDKSKDKPATPAEEYQALVREFSQAQQAFFKAYSEAPTDDAKQQMFKEKYPAFGPKFLALAEKHPKDPAAVDALVWVVTNSISRVPDKENSVAKALDQLLKNHLGSDKLASACESLAFGSTEDAAGSFLKTVLEKSPNKAAQAEACLALGQRAQYQIRLIQEMQKDPAEVKQVEQAFGKEYVERLQKADVAKLEAESEGYFRRFIDTYRSDLKPARLANLCTRMAFFTDKGSEGLLRALLEDARPEVQGPACLFLATMLSRRAESLPDPKSAEAAKLFKESEELLERATAKYADIKLEFYGPIGKKAEKELYSLRHLSVGKSAPDVEAEDQDGKKFKLSDYRGKVVLLDFWSEF
jgi:hypothetical protein